MDHDYYVKPNQYEIEIKGANNTLGNKLKVPSSGFAILTPTDLGLPSNESCIPDGVFSVQTETCGDTFLRYKALTVGMECRLKNALVKGEDPLRIAKLKTQVESIHYNLERDMIVEANKLFKIVKKEIDLIECDCDCCN